ncbi:MAG: LytR/AlgR family response regulator transcription factor [Flectobacillus sp.]|uniref:LytR/AlgR family response regulator transcription factor n=1 Tax=Flectobacillus sp. TaxID=50419 RepID=UPI003B98EF30
MNPISCLILEDTISDQLDIELILQHYPMIDATYVNTPKSFLNAIKENDYQLYFMDIHISSDITGVDLLASVRNPGAWVILNSSYLTDEYYEEYKKIDCRKYCISKPLNQFSIRTILDELVSQTAKNHTIGHTTEFVMVKQGDYLHKINIDTILYFESSGHLVYIKTKEAKYATYGSLKHYESLVQGKPFEKINRNVIINLLFVQKINIKEDFIEIDNVCFSLSRIQKKEFIEKFDRLILK